jgi:hypothetical protein
LKTKKQQILFQKGDARNTRNKTDLKLLPCKISQPVAKDKKGN